MAGKHDTHDYREADSPFFVEEQVDDLWITGQGVVSGSEPASRSGREDESGRSRHVLRNRVPVERKKRQDRSSKGEDVAAFNEKSVERFSVDRRTRIIIALIVVTVALVPLTMVLPTHLFNLSGFDSDLARLNASITGRIEAASQMFSGTAAGRAMAIYFWQTVAVAVAGAGLAMNGAVFQGSLKNALASPSTLGVMSGASLGSVIYSVFYLLPNQDASGPLRSVADIAQTAENLDFAGFVIASSQRAFFSLVGSFAIVALVLIIATAAGRGRVSKVGLVIAGQVFATTIAGIIDMLRFYLRDHGTEAQMSALRNASVGGFDEMWGPYQVATLSIPIIIGVIVIMALSYRLNLLAFNDQEARTMGVSVTATRNAVIVVCTVLTAVIVSLVGSIGFVGFIVPHLARKMVGPDFRYFIPASIFLGSAYLLLANYLANMSGIFQGSVGTLTSIIGVVFFAVMAIRQRARGNVDWI